MCVVCVLGSNGLCAVLCCAVLCCAVLCCAVLCCMCCAVLCCAVLCCAVLCCAVLCCVSVSPSLTFWRMWLSPGLPGKSICVAEECSTISMATKRNKMAGNIIPSTSFFVPELLAVAACEYEPNETFLCYNRLPSCVYCPY